MKITDKSCLLLLVLAVQFEEDLPAVDLGLESHVLQVGPRELAVERVHLWRRRFLAVLEHDWDELVDARRHFLIAEVEHAFVLERLPHRHYGLHMGVFHPQALLPRQEPDLDRLLQAQVVVVRRSPEDDVDVEVNELLRVLASYSILNR